MMAKKTEYTTGDLAAHFQVRDWQIRRVFERGLVQERGRLGKYRLVYHGDLPAVERALRQLGYLPGGVAV